MQLAKYFRFEKFQPSLRTSVFSSLGANLIETKRSSFKKFVKVYCMVEDARRYIKLGDYKKSYEVLENFTGSCTAFIWKISDSLHLY